MPLPSFRLDDRVALVTGAASGIGREIALGLAESGAAVGCVDLTDPSGTVADIEALGGRAVAASADVTDPDGAVVAHEGAEAGALREVTGDVGAGRLGVVLDDRR